MRSRLTLTRRSTSQNSQNKIALSVSCLKFLVDEYWGDAAADTKQSNIPIKVIAYPIPTPR